MSRHKHTVLLGESWQHSAHVLHAYVDAHVDANAHAGVDADADADADDDADAE